MISIDSLKCEACGICGEVCPRHIIEILADNDKKSASISKDRIDLCMECGHCQAVCPNYAISVDRFRNMEFKPVTELALKEDQLLTLLKQRRSVRRYRKKSVPRDLLDQIIQGVHQAPTGTGRVVTGVIVVNNEKILSTLSGMFYELYEKLDKGLKNPIGRFVIKKRVGNPALNTLLNFVMPGMRWYIQWYRQGKSNEILRDCPALMLFHSPILEPMASQNCTIAAFHAIFMAQALGIGTCFNDLIPPACNRNPDVRDLLGLPDDREVYSSITLGYPKYKFKRTIPRQLAEVRYLQ